MAKTKTKAAKAQRTVQMLSFAVKLRKEVLVALKKRFSLSESPTIVASAAMLAFSQLPVDEQLKHITESRERLVSGSGG